MTSPPQRMDVTAQDAKHFEGVPRHTLIVTNFMEAILHTLSGFTQVRHSGAGADAGAEDDRSTASSDSLPVGAIETRSLAR